MKSVRFCQDYLVDLPETQTDQPPRPPTKLQGSGAYITMRRFPGATRHAPRLWTPPASNATNPFHAPKDTSDPQPHFLSVGRQARNDPFTVSRVRSSLALLAEPSLPAATRRNAALGRASKPRRSRARRPRRATPPRPVPRGFALRPGLCDGSGQAVADGDEPASCEGRALRNPRVG